MKKPNILITNDDGIFSSGIFALWEVLNPISNLTVVAPKTQQSAKSHALTLSKPLRLNLVERSNGFKGWAVTGTPVDCVKIGLKTKTIKKPDLLISGINQGANVGDNIIYSATVSAANEGVLNNVPSIALSLNSFKSNYWKLAKKIALKVINSVLKNGLPKGVLLNVNIPNCKSNQLKGYKITEKGNQYFNDNFKKRKDPRDNIYYWIDGKIIDRDKDFRFDGYAIANNYVSVTPLKFDLTEYSYIDALKENFINE